MTINFGINEGKDHRTYFANVDLGGMALTAPALTGSVVRGERSTIWAYYMEAQYKKYDVTIPGEATQIAFHEIAKGVVNGWTCK